MHISNDTDDFRNKKYLEDLRREYLNMFRAYHRYISYHNKLCKELTLSDKDIVLMKDIDKDFCEDVKRAERRIQKSDFNGIIP